MTETKVKRGENKSYLSQIFVMEQTTPPVIQEESCWQAANPPAIDQHFSTDYGACQPDPSRMTGKKRNQCLNFILPPVKNTCSLQLEAYSFTK
jgi:hypothetical protein